MWPACESSCFAKIGIFHVLRFYASESAWFLKEQTWETWGTKKKNKQGLFFGRFWHECRDNDLKEMIGLSLKFSCRCRNLLQPEGIILKAQQRRVLVVLVLTVLPINVSKMVQEGRLQHPCQRHTSLPRGLVSLLFHTKASWSFSVSSCGLRPPLFVLFWKSKVFSTHFLFISYSHSTAVRQTWWLRHWPFTYQNISLLSHFLEGKWKVFCSSGGQRCCFMYGCEDFWSRARHTCWVGGEKWRDMNFWNSPVCWRKIAHINVVAAEATKKN